jgi:hypothetical protein
MTNVLNMHTCSIGLINLFIVVVYISHDKLIQISDHLISCPSVSNISRFFFPHVCRIKPLVALEDGVIGLSTKLARGGWERFFTLSNGSPLPRMIMFEPPLPLRPPRLCVKPPRSCEA